MPVSKKRKKDGKPVKRHDAGAQHAEEHHAGAAPAAPDTLRPRAGKPSNPFVAQQQSKRGAQRGR